MGEIFHVCSGIPYLRFGTIEPLVFIHELGEVKEGWSKQFEFADQFDLIIPDLHGHNAKVLLYFLNKHKMAG